MAEGPKTIKLGDIVVGITDPANILPVNADIFTELWAANGVTHISFASLIKDGDGATEARVVCRVRLNIGSVIDLHKSFGEILQREMPSKETMN
jgi:hypothetical protein